jgi:hypothetical protein
MDLKRSPQKQSLNASRKEKIQAEALSKQHEMVNKKEGKE